jgi:hypothetical protein
VDRDKKKSEKRGIVWMEGRERETDEMTYFDQQIRHVGFYALLSL